MTKEAPTPQQAAHAAAIERFALAELHVSEMNPRDHDDPSSVERLAGSILAIGLLHNLAGLRGDDGRIGIVAGGRRLRALKLIAMSQPDLPLLGAIPVAVTDDPVEAQGWASAENIARAPLHPADEIAAFAAMARQQWKLPDIAKAFGTTERHVRGRLKLAVLPEEILQALSRDEITLDVAAAYTVGECEEAMLAVFNEMSGSHWGQHAREIRARLTGQGLAADGKLGRFVGREAYEAAGGALTENLFGDEVWFIDRAILEACATARLQEAAEALRSEEGWSWVSSGLEAMAFEEVAGRVYPTRPAITEAEAERYDLLAEAAEDDELSDGEAQELEALQAKMETEVFTEEAKGVAGAHVTIGWNGEVSVSRGIVTTESIDAAIEAGVVSPDRHVASTCTSATSGQGAEKPAYSHALITDLARVRTGALQAAILAKPELALDILAFVLSHQCQTDATVMHLRLVVPDNAPEKDEGLTLPECLSAGDLAESYLSGPDAVSAFLAFRGQPKKARNAVLTRVIVRAIAATVTTDRVNPMVEELARLSGMDVRAVWTPTRDFLKRLKKDQLLEIYDCVMQKPDGRRQLEKQAKSNVVSWLHHVFAGDGKVPMTSEQKARAKSWLPDGMAVAPSGVDREGCGDNARPVSGPPAKVASAVVDADRESALA